MPFVTIVWRGTTDRSRIEYSSAPSGGMAMTARELKQKLSEQFGCRPESLAIGEWKSGGTSSDHLNSTIQPTTATNVNGGGGGDANMLGDQLPEDTRVQPYSTIEAWRLSEQEIRHIKQLNATGNAGSHGPARGSNAGGGGRGAGRSGRSSRAGGTDGVIKVRADGSIYQKGGGHFNHKDRYRANDEERGQNTDADDVAECSGSRDNDLAQLRKVMNQSGLEGTMIRRPGISHYMTSTGSLSTEEGATSNEPALHPAEPEVPTAKTAPTTRRQPPAYYICDNCHTKGHFKRDCPFPPGTARMLPSNSLHITRVPTGIQGSLLEPVNMAEVGANGGIPPGINTNDLFRLNDGSLVRRVVCSHLFVPIINKDANHGDDAAQCRLNAGVEASTSINPIACNEPQADGAPPEFYCGLCHKLMAPEEARALSCCCDAAAPPGSGADGSTVGKPCCWACLERYAADNDDTTLCPWCQDLYLLEDCHNGPTTTALQQRLREYYSARDGAHGQAKGTTVDASEMKDRDEVPHERVSLKRDRDGP